MLESFSILTWDVWRTVAVVVILDLPVSVRQFPQIIYSSSNCRGCRPRISQRQMTPSATSRPHNSIHPYTHGRGTRDESVGCEIVATQVDPIIVRKNVINVDLITVFQVVEEEVHVCNWENQVLHAQPKLHSLRRILFKTSMKFCPKI